MQDTNQQQLVLPEKSEDLLAMLKEKLFPIRSFVPGAVSSDELWWYQGVQHVVSTIEQLKQNLETDADELFTT